MAFDYFYGAQSQQFAFYRIPKVLLQITGSRIFPQRERSFTVFIGQGISVNGKRLD
mgnify:CR=1 FL=1